MINNEEFQDEIGNNHISTNAKNPLRDDAFAIADDEKIERIKKDVANILTTLGMDLTDDSLKGTPNRVAKMFVKEIFGIIYLRSSLAILNIISTSPLGIMVKLSNAIWNLC
mgnify:CR=1 FL=1